MEDTMAFSFAHPDHLGARGTATAEGLAADDTPLLRCAGGRCTCGACQQEVPVPSLAAAALQVLRDPSIALTDRLLLLQKFQHLGSVADSLEANPPPPPEPKTAAPAASSKAAGGGSRGLTSSVPAATRVAPLPAGGTAAAAASASSAATGSSTSSSAAGTTTTTSASATASGVSVYTEELYVPREFDAPTGQLGLSDTGGDTYGTMAAALVHSGILQRFDLEAAQASPLYVSDVLHQNPYTTGGSKNPGGLYGDGTDDFDEDEYDDEDGDEDGGSATPPPEEEEEAAAATATATTDATGSGGLDDGPPDNVLIVFSHNLVFKMPVKDDAVPLPAPPSAAGGSAVDMATTTGSAAGGAASSTSTSAGAASADPLAWTPSATSSAYYSGGSSSSSLSGVEHRLSAPLGPFSAASTSSGIAMSVVEQMRNRLGLWCTYLRTKDASAACKDVLRRRFHLLPPKQRAKYLQAPILIPTGVLEDAHFWEALAGHRVAHILFVGCNDLPASKLEAHIGRLLRPGGKVTYILPSTKESFALMAPSVARKLHGLVEEASAAATAAATASGSASAADGAATDSAAITAPAPAVATATAVPNALKLQGVRMLRQRAGGATDISGVKLPDRTCLQLVRFTASVSPTGIKVRATPPAAGASTTAADTASAVGSVTWEKHSWMLGCGTVADGDGFPWLKVHPALYRTLPGSYHYTPHDAHTLGYLPVHRVGSNGGTQLLEVLWEGNLSGIGYAVMRDPTAPPPDDKSTIKQGYALNGTSLGECLQVWSLPPSPDCPVSGSHDRHLELSRVPLTQARTANIPAVVGALPVATPFFVTHICGDWMKLCPSALHAMDVRQPFDPRVCGWVRREPSLRLVPVGPGDVPLFVAATEATFQLAPRADAPGTDAEGETDEVEVLMPANAAAASDSAGSSSSSGDGAVGGPLAAAYLALNAKHVAAAAPSKSLKLRVLAPTDTDDTADDASKRLRVYATKSTTAAVVGHISLPAAEESSSSSAADSSEAVELVVSAYEHPWVKLCPEAGYSSVADLVEHDRAKEGWVLLHAPLAKGATTSPAAARVAIDAAAFSTATLAAWRDTAAATPELAPAVRTWCARTAFVDVCRFQLPSKGPVSPTWPPVDVPKDASTAAAFAAVVAKPTPDADAAPVPSAPAVGESTDAAAEAAAAAAAEAARLAQLDQADSLPVQGIAKLRALLADALGSAGAPARLPSSAAEWSALRTSLLQSALPTIAAVLDTFPATLAAVADANAPRAGVEEASATDGAGDTKDAGDSKAAGGAVGAGTSAGAAMPAAGSATQSADTPSGAGGSARLIIKQPTVAAPTFARPATAAVATSSSLAPVGGASSSDSSEMRPLAHGDSGYGRAYAPMGSVLASDSDDDGSTGGDDSGVPSSDADLGEEGDTVAALGAAAYQATSANPFAAKASYPAASPPSSGSAGGPSASVASGVFKVLEGHVRTPALVDSLAVAKVALSDAGPSGRTGVFCVPSDFGPQPPRPWGDASAGDRLALTPASFSEGLNAKAVPSASAARALADGTQLLVASVRAANAIIQHAAGQEAAAMGAGSADVPWWSAIHGCVEAACLLAAFVLSGGSTRFLQTTGVKQSVDLTVAVGSAGSATIAVFDSMHYSRDTYRDSLPHMKGGSGTPARAPAAARDSTPTRSRGAQPQKPTKVSSKALSPFPPTGVGAAATPARAPPAPRAAWKDVPSAAAPTNIAAMRALHEKQAHADAYCSVVDAVLGSPDASAFPTAKQRASYLNLLSRCFGPQYGRYMQAKQHKSAGPFAAGTDLPETLAMLTPVSAQAVRRGGSIVVALLVAEAASCGLLSTIVSRGLASTVVDPTGPKTAVAARAALHARDTAAFAVDLLHRLRFYLGPNAAAVVARAAGATTTGANAVDDCKTLLRRLTAATSPLSAEAAWNVLVPPQAASGGTDIAAAHARTVRDRVRAFRSFGAAAAYLNARGQAVQCIFSWAGKHVLSSLDETCAPPKPAASQQDARTTASNPYATPYGSSAYGSSAYGSSAYGGASYASPPVPPSAAGAGSSSATAARAAATALRAAPGLGLRDVLQAVTDMLAGVDTQLADALSVARAHATSCTSRQQFVVAQALAKLRSAVDPQASSRIANKQQEETLRLQELATALSAPTSDPSSADSSEPPAPTAAAGAASAGADAPKKKKAASSSSSSGYMQKSLWSSSDQVGGVAIEHLPKAGGKLAIAGSYNKSVYFHRYLATKSEQGVGLRQVPTEVQVGLRSRYAASYSYSAYSTPTASPAPAARTSRPAAPASTRPSAAAVATSFVWWRAGFTVADRRCASATHLDEVLALADKPFKPSRTVSIVLRRTPTGKGAAGAASAKSAASRDAGATIEWRATGGDATLICSTAQASAASKAYASSSYGASATSAKQGVFPWSASSSNKYAAATASSAYYGSSSSSSYGAPAAPATSSVIGTDGFASSPTTDDPLYAYGLYAGATAADPAPSSTYAYSGYPTTALTKQAFKCPEIDRVLLKDLLRAETDAPVSSSSRAFAPATSKPLLGRTQQLLQPQTTAEAVDVSLAAADVAVSGPATPSGQLDALLDDLSASNSARESLRAFAGAFKAVWGALKSAVVIANAAIAAGTATAAADAELQSALGVIATIVDACVDHSALLQETRLRACYAALSATAGVDATSPAIVPNDARKGGWLWNALDAALTVAAMELSGEPHAYGALACAVAFVDTLLSCPLTAPICLRTAKAPADTAAQYAVAICAAKLPLVGFGRVPAPAPFVPEGASFPDASLAASPTTLLASAVAASGKRFDAVLEHMADVAQGAHKIGCLLSSLKVLAAGFDVEGDDAAVDASTPSPVSDGVPDMPSSPARPSKNAATTTDAAGMDSISAVATFTAQATKRCTEAALAFRTTYLAERVPVPAPVAPPASAASAGAGGASDQSAGAAATGAAVDEVDEEEEAAVETEAIPASAIVPLLPETTAPFETLLVAKDGGDTASSSSKRSATKDRARGVVALMERLQLGLSTVPYTPPGKSLVAKYCKALRAEMFDTIEGIKSSNILFKLGSSAAGGAATSSSKVDEATASKALITRLNTEFASMQADKSLVAWPSSMLLRADETDITYLRAAIFGPADTPYQNGFFQFDIHAQAGVYPDAPPQVKILTNAGGTCRFNPNLYSSDNGKVCLSLLGTWGTLSWVPKKNNIANVLTSIQALVMVNVPYTCEPAYEGYPSTAAGPVISAHYNARVRLATLRHAMIDALKTPPTGYERAVAAHFWFKRDEIKAQALQWAQEAIIIARHEAACAVAMDRKSQDDRSKVLAAAVTRLEAAASGAVAPSSVKAISGDVKQCDSYPVMNSLQPDGSVYTAGDAFLATALASDSAGAAASTATAESKPATELLVAKLSQLLGRTTIGVRRSAPPAAGGASSAGGDGITAAAAGDGAATTTAAGGSAAAAGAAPAAATTAVAPAATAAPAAVEQTGPTIDALQQKLLDALYELEKLREGGSGKKGKEASKRPAPTFDPAGKNAQAALAALLEVQAAIGSTVPAAAASAAAASGSSELEPTASTAAGAAGSAGAASASGPAAASSGSASRAGKGVDADKRMRNEFMYKIATETLRATEELLNLLEGLKAPEEEEEMEF